MSPKSVRIPTPPIGTPVVYYPKANYRLDPHPAVVDAIGPFPGVVRLRSLRNTIGAKPDGVIWVGDSDPMRKEGSDQRNENGVWDFLPDYVVPEGWYDAPEAQKKRHADRLAALSKPAS